MTRFEKLNLTIGGFNFAFSEMFEEENGQTRAALNALQELLETIGAYGNFEILLKTSKEDNFGLLTEDVYETGVLGMLQRKEVDVCFIPLPLDIPNPPGIYSPVIHDDAYHIYSYPRTISSVTQNIATSLGSINLSLWLSMTVLMGIMETINHLIILQSTKRNQCDLLLSSIRETGKSFASTILRQYFPGRSVLRTVEIIGIMLFTFMLGASFRTDTIVGNDEVKINTLKNVIEQEKTPYWLEGESVAELFQKGVTPDYKRIYEMGEEKGTQTPIPISSLELITSRNSGTVYFCSNEIARAVYKISEACNLEIVKHEYKSPKPYHRAMTAFLMNPVEHSKEIQRRIKNLAIRQIQGDIFIQGLRRIINDLLIESTLDIKRHQLFLNYRESDKHQTHFEPLNFNGCRIVFITWGSAVMVTLFVHLVEICSGQFSKCVKPEKRSCDLIVQHCTIRKRVN